MATISITVPEDAAERFRCATPEERRKLELILSLRLQDLVDRPPRSVAEIMNEVGSQVSAAGLTEADLESLLDDR